MRLLLTSIVTIFLSLSPALAATVSCAFMSETSISKSGEWLKTEMDFRDLHLLGESNSLSQFGDDNTHADDKPKTSDEFNNSFEMAPKSMG